ncbi:MAG: insulinase family protein [Bacteroidales bacterium]|nr:insulinase family protein [Bacteroidales bacterium]
MPHRVIRLRNGLRLLHIPTASPISHFGILIDAGTRDEPGQHPGLAHFVEHTIFKGTEKRNAYRVINRMESVGGDLNASTSKEETDFYASFLSPDYPRAVELLADIFFHAIFPQRELEKEKTVIFEEINYYNDSPSELIFDDFESLVFHGHDMGKSILGTKESVQNIHREDITAFIAENYTLENVVLASVGNISMEKLVRLCEKHFGNGKMRQGCRKRVTFRDYCPQTRRVCKSTSQTNVLTGAPAYDIRHPKRIPFMLLNNILGGQGQNTRLNMSVREKKGLAYTVESYFNPFSDCGLFSVYFGCDAHERDHCLELVRHELEKLKRQKLGTLQLYYAKKQYIGQLALAQESKLNELLASGHLALFYDEVGNMDENIQTLEKITAEELCETANEIFDLNRFSTLIFDPEEE